MTTFDVLDCHHHVGDPMTALGGAIGTSGTSGTPDRDDSALAELTAWELAERLRIMDAGGVRQAVVIPGHGYLRANGIADTRRVNDDIAAYRDRTPERFPVAVGIVEPQHGAASFAELDRCRHELSLAGISFHTRFQGVSLDSRWITSYVERMGELGLVPVIHCIPESPDEALWKLVALARAFPDLPMLVLDAFEAYETTREITAIADLVPAVCFDTSLSYNFDFIEELRPSLRSRAGRVRDRSVLGAPRPAHQPSPPADPGVVAARRRQGCHPRRQRPTPLRPRSAGPRSPGPGRAVRA